MNYTIHSAIFDDLPAILALQDKVIQTLPDSSYFAAESETFFAQILGTKGHIHLAKIQEKLIGCSVLYFPEEEARDNLGFDLAFLPQQRRQVAHLDSAFIDYSCQGMGVAKALSLANIQYALAHDKKYILATAHPLNFKSIKNLFSLHCIIVGFAYKYPDLPRFILRYTSVDFQNSKSDFVQIKCDDFEGHQQCLAQGLIGLRIFQSEEGVSIVYHSVSL